VRTSLTATGAVAATTARLLGVVTPWFSNIGFELQFFSDSEHWFSNTSSGTSIF